MNYNFIFYYPSIERGGLEKNLFFLVNSLAEKNYQVKLITYADNTKNNKLKKNFILTKKLI